MPANDVFVDTAGFLALWDAADEHHAAAVRLQADLAHRRRGFLTTDYVVDETITLLLLRHSRAIVVDFLNSVIESEALFLEWIGSERFYAAASLFRRHEDKQWSFTDCTSFAVMQQLRIQDSFTTDHHFRQAGFVALLRQ